VVELKEVQRGQIGAYHAPYPLWAFNPNSTRCYTCTTKKWAS